MALIECKFFSEALLTNTSIYVIVPTPNSDELFSNSKKEYYNPDEKFQTLYLLHGALGDYTDWIRFSSIEKYAEKHRLAIVMPTGENSFYNDIPNGNRYWTYISEELPKVARGLFPLSDKKEDNFVAGLSMGGYGAFKLALRKSKDFSAAASLSGVVDVSSFLGFSVDNAIDSFKSVLSNAFGDIRNIKNSENDLLYLLETKKRLNDDLPKLYLCCGTEDSLYPINVNFNIFAKQLGVDLTYEEGPGSHNWEFWDKYIEKVLAWLPLKNNIL